MHRLISLLFSLTVAASVFAQRQNSRVRIDGKLNDALWQRVPAEELAPPEAGVQASTGGMPATLGALYEPDVKIVFAHGRLPSFLSMHQDGSLYVPQDVIVPGVLELGDIGTVADALAPRPVKLEGMVNSKNKLISEDAARMQIAEPSGKLPEAIAIRAGEETAGLADWFHANL